MVIFCCLSCLVRVTLLGRGTTYFQCPTSGIYGFERALVRFYDKSGCIKETFAFFFCAWLLMFCACVEAEVSPKPPSLHVFTCISTGLVAGIGVWWWWGEEEEKEEEEAEEAEEAEEEEGEEEEDEEEEEEEEDNNDDARWWNNAMIMMMIGSCNSHTLWLSCQHQCIPFPKASPRCHDQDHDIQNTFLVFSSSLAYRLSNLINLSMHVLKSNQVSNLTNLSLHV